MDDEASTGTVIPFPGAAKRPARPEPRSDEPRGAILLFTGVRYERPSTALAPTPAPSGSPKARRKRRPT